MPCFWMGLESAAYPIDPKAPTTTAAASTLHIDLFMANPFESRHCAKCPLTERVGRGHHARHHPLRRGMQVQRRPAEFVTVFFQNLEKWRRGLRATVLGNAIKVTLPA